MLPVTVTAALHDAWIDLNATANGTMTENTSAEHLVRARSWRGRQNQTFSITIHPCPAGSSRPFLRPIPCQLNAGSGLRRSNVTLDEEAVDGEGEDYRVFLVSERATTRPPDGIAGATLPDAASSNGASHVFVPGLSLGQRVDGSSSGSPAGTDGDDKAYPTAAPTTKTAYRSRPTARHARPPRAGQKPDHNRRHQHFQAWTPIYMDGSTSTATRWEIRRADSRQRRRRPARSRPRNLLILVLSFSIRTSRRIFRSGDTYARFRLSTDEKPPTTVPRPTARSKTTSYDRNRRRHDQGLNSTKSTNSGSVDAARPAPGVSLPRFEQRRPVHAARHDGDGIRIGASRSPSPAATTATPGVNEAGCSSSPGSSRV